MACFKQVTVSEYCGLGISEIEIAPDYSISTFNTGVRWCYVSGLALHDMMERDLEFEVRGSAFKS